MIIWMSDMKPGQSGTVCRVDLPFETRLRYYELGLIPGTEIDCLFVSPLGDPTAFRVRDTVFAFRAADVAGVSVRQAEAAR